MHTNVNINNFGEKGTMACNITDIYVECMHIWHIVDGYNFVIIISNTWHIQQTYIAFKLCQRLVVHIHT